MNRGQLPTNQLQDNWGALDSASHAPQLMSRNYYITVDREIFVVKNFFIDD